MPIVVCSVPKDLQIRLRREAHLPAQDPATRLGALVQAIWEKERIQRPSVRNGPLLCHEGREGDTLWARRTDYMHFIAQLRAPELRPDLDITVLSVSGLLHDHDVIAFGLRSMQMTQNPGEWELVPSGGLAEDAVRGDEVSPVDQVLSELGEEVGLARSSVISAEPFALVHDGESNVMDIGIDLTVRNWHVSQPPTHEYERIEKVAMKDLSAFFVDRRVIPVSRLLLELRGYLSKDI